MRFVHQESEEIHINLTPLIDVVFLLLLFFMVTTSFKQQSAIDINLPNASASTSLKDPLSLILSVDKNQDISFATSQSALQAPNLTEQTLVNRISSAIAQLKEQTPKQNTDAITVIIEADKNTRHEQIIAIMDALATLEINQIQFAVDSRIQQK